MRFKTILATLIMLALTVGVADAKPKKNKKKLKKQYNIVKVENTRNDSYMYMHGVDGISQFVLTGSNTTFTKASKAERTGYSTAPGVGGTRPSDCPRAWCGCWLSKEVFGKNIRDLWVAKNWLKFRKTSPAPGTIAVMGRRGGGHVGKVLSVNGSTVTLISGNSTGRRVAVGDYPIRRMIAFVSP